MSDPELCVQVDPWGVVLPCGTPDPCSADGETTLWRGDDCAATDAPTMWEWCQTVAHPLCADVQAPFPMPVATLPTTGGGGLLLIAAALVAGGLSLRRIAAG